MLILGNKGEEHMTDERQQSNTPSWMKRMVLPVVLTLGAAISGGCQQQNANQVFNKEGNGANPAQPTIVQKDKVATFSATAFADQNPMNWKIDDINKDKEYFRSLKATLDKETGALNVTGKSASGEEIKIKIEKGAAINFGPAAARVVINGKVYQTGFGQGINDGTERTAKSFNDTCQKAADTLEKMGPEVQKMQTKGKGRGGR